MRKGFLLPILVMIGAVIAFGVLAYFAASNPSSKNTNTQVSAANTATYTNATAQVDTNSTVTTNTNSNADDVTKGWKTYTDQTNNFTVPYPNTWKTTNCDGSSSVIFAPQSIHCGTEGVGEAVTITPQETTFTATQHITNLLSEPSIDYAAKTTLTVSGFPATRVTGTTNNKIELGRAGQRVDEVFVNVPGRYYIVSHAGEASDTASEKIFTDMLTHMSFVEQAADWKTYTNTKYGYTLKYPTTWALHEDLGPDTIQFSPPDAAAKTSIELGPTLFVTYASAMDKLSDSVRNRTTMIINGLTVTQQEEGGMGNSITTYFPKTGGGFITTSWDDSFTYPEYDQIRSTFAFKK